MVWNKAKVNEESSKFDKAAEIYDKYRPSYPAEMVDDFIELTGVDLNDSLLEVGAGSGKATELFVDRGYSISCVELGQNLADVGLDKFKDTDRVRYYVGRFEELEGLPTNNKVIFSAQAFHWIPKPQGYEKVSQLLSEDGYCVLFWNRYFDDGLDSSKVLNDICREYRLMPLVDNDELISMNTREVEAIKHSGCFENVRLLEYPWSETHNLFDFINFLKTTNSYMGMEQNMLDELNSKLEQVFADGPIRRSYVCSMFLMRKL